MGLVHWFRGLVYVEWVSLNTHSASIQRQFQLDATITPSNATNKNIVWTSSNTNIATVENWLVTPTWEGSVTITANVDWYTDSCTLNVSLIHVTGVSLNKNSTTINVWWTEQLIASITPNDASNQNVTWSSSNTSVATVSNTWLVTYVADGNCTITATTVDWWYTATCNVTCVSKLKVNFLLVWWWWGGSQFYWWGWGWWWVIQCTNYEINVWSYPVVIWAWGSWQWTCCDWYSWWNSTFNWLTSYGWWYWWGSSRKWWNWWSWGWAWYRATAASCIWYWCSWQWYNWWCSVSNGSWGWGWAWGAWCTWTTYYWWVWWAWVVSNISWTTYYYSPWWTWHSWYDYCQSWNSTWWAASWARALSNATCYWWWWWWTSPNASYWKWKAGIFILAYPSSCWYNITGWTKYLCNWNCIHCFTWNGTLTIS